MPKWKAKLQEFSDPKDPASGGGAAGERREDKASSSVAAGGNKEQQEPTPLNDKTARQIKMLVEEYYNCADVGEASLCLQELHETVPATGKGEQALKHLDTLNVETVYVGVTIMLEATVCHHCCC